MSEWRNTMGRVEIRHYPASKLPDDLRGSIGINASVNIVVEEDEQHEKPITRDALKAMLSRSVKGNGVSVDESVRRILHSFT
jgi:hypothetical protein